MNQRFVALSKSVSLGISATMARSKTETSVNSILSASLDAATRTPALKVISVSGGVKSIASVIPNVVRGTFALPPTFVI